MLLWVMGMGFENTCTVSRKQNVSLVVPRLPLLLGELWGPSRETSTQQVTSKWL